MTRRKAKNEDTVDIVDYIKDRYEDQQRKITARHTAWGNDIAFYLGFQWYSWNAGTLAYFAPPHEDINGMFMITGNLIKPLVDARIAKYVGNRPQITVTAQTEDPLAMEKAEHETRILNALWKALNMRTKLVDAAHWMVITNQCFHRVRWDKNYGEGFTNPAYIDEVATPNLEKTMRPGTIAIDRLNGHQIIFDQTKKSWNEVREKGWVIIKSVMTKESLLRAFPEKEAVIKGLKAEHIGTTGESEEQMLYMQDQGTVESRKDEKNRKGEYQTVTVYEFYEAPTKSDPNGMYAVIAGYGDSKRLHRGALPNNLKKIPIIMFQDQMGLDTLWGRSLVSHSRQLQKFYNLILSKIFSYCMLPVIYGYPRGCQLDLESLPDDPYIITEYDGEEGQPVIISPADPPQLWMFVLNYIQGQLEHYWGTHEVSMRGSTPGNTRLSGRGIYLLQEGDVQRHAPWYMTWEDSLEDEGELILEIAKDKFDETRQMTFIGDDGKPYPIEFSKNDISGKCKVQVEVGTEFMRNKQGMQKFFTDTMNAIPNLPLLGQIINEPTGLHNMFSLLDETLANRLVYNNQDTKTAERENRELLHNGVIEQVENWHVHPLHLKQHVRMMNTLEYKNLPAQLKAEWEQKHLGMHGQMMQRAIQVMQAQQQQAQAQAQGGGGQVFRQGGQGVVDPLMNMIDMRVENKVQPDPGQFGMEETP